MPDHNDLTCGQLSALAIALVVVSTGISAASAAAGMETLNAKGYPGYTEINEAVTAAAIGTSIVSSALLFLKITSTLCCATIGIELEANKNSAEPVFGGVASIVAGMLVGHTITRATGLTKQLELGPAIAASAVGGAEITAGLLLLLCCGVCYCICFKIDPTEALDARTNADATTRNLVAVLTDEDSLTLAEEGRCTSEVSTNSTAMNREWDRRRKEIAVATPVVNPGVAPVVAKAYYTSQQQCTICVDR